MQYRNLTGTELRPSVIGFGCASVLGKIGAARSRRALDAALDAGINYFDVARSYGFGAAEGFLGNFLRGRRDQILLASKFGIAPPKRNTLADHLRPLVRPAFEFLGRISPKAQQNLRHRASGIASRNQFGISDARQSLEQSLRELQTDRLDIWLLHDCTAEVAGDDELFTFLDSTVAAGKVRYYGVASGLDAAAAVLNARPAARVAQFSNSAADDAVRRFQRLAAGTACPVVPAIVTHSPFAQGALRQNLSGYLARNAESARRWSTLLDLDLLSPTGITEFLLRFAVISNPNGIVICGMYDPAHIRANAEAVQRAATSEFGPAEQVAKEMRERLAWQPS
jgi:aryl-alcohol dehydrogenase-like predicted oxidoreductase